jgi:hypothetical protein
MSNITLKIRQGSGEQFDVSVAADCTILALKEACVEQSKLEASNMRLIFKGRILKDD